MMDRDELVNALRKVSLPGAFRCVCCEYESRCTIYGCAVIREAMRRLADDDVAMRLLNLALYDQTYRDSDRHASEGGERCGGPDFPGVC